METPYIKKYIKTLDDLPEKDGYYTYHLKGELDWITHYDWFDLVRDKEEIIETFDWYLSPDPRIEELIKAQQELIDFYGKNISDNAVFLQIHHMGASLEDCNKGEELRTRIEVLRKEVEYEL